MANMEFVLPEGLSEKQRNFQLQSKRYTERQLRRLVKTMASDPIGVGNRIYGPRPAMSWTETLRRLFRSEKKPTQVDLMCKIQQLGGNIMKTFYENNKKGK